ncbi:MAG: hypothetical protein DRG59_09595 [Deltaproteobacteria bacterium]|nr:MAG: hypothetical protein DRG59_09595 [Deltaproteobacteria bacterium]
MLAPNLSTFSSDKLSGQFSKNTQGIGAISIHQPRDGAESWLESFAKQMHKMEKSYFSDQGRK